jgi:hypothetical protein
MSIVYVYENNIVAAEVNNLVKLTTQQDYTKFNADNNNSFDKLLDDFTGRKTTIPFFFFEYIFENYTHAKTFIHVFLKKYTEYKEVVTPGPGTFKSSIRFQSSQRSIDTIIPKTEHVLETATNQNILYPYRPPRIERLTSRSHVGIEGGSTKSRSTRKHKRS